MTFGEIVLMGILMEPWMYNGHFRSKGMCANWDITTESCWQNLMHLKTPSMCFRKIHEIWRVLTLYFHMLKHIRQFWCLPENSACLPLKNETENNLQIFSEGFLSLQFSFRHHCLVNKAGNTDVNNRILIGFFYPISLYFTILILLR